MGPYHKNLSVFLKIEKKLNGECLEDFFKYISIDKLHGEASPVLPTTLKKKKLHQEKVLCYAVVWELK